MGPSSRAVVGPLEPSVGRLLDEGTNTSGPRGTYGCACAHHDGSMCACEDLIRIAHQTAPQGYWLQHIEAIGGEPHRRDVFKKSVLSSNRKPPNVQVSGPARSDGSA